MSTLKREHGSGTSNLSDKEKTLEQCHFYGLLTDKQHAHIKAAMQDDSAVVKFEKDTVGHSTTIILTVTYKAYHS